MDIKTIIEAKRQCESEIRAILKMFEQQSECNVQGINIGRVKKFGMASEVTNIYLDMRIDEER